MRTYVALLRGINLGARNKLPMGELRSSLTSMGLEEVETYVQSGNVVFGSAGDADEVANAVERRIASEFGLHASVIVRTPAELRKIVDGNPFLGDEGDATKLLVVFLERAPAASARSQLDRERSPPDRFSVRGREIYLHVPNGFGRSKLGLDYFERRLGVEGTVRNWRTVTQLLAMVDRRGA